MKKTGLFTVLLALGLTVHAQQSEKYPLGDYQELTDTKPHDAPEVWNKLIESVSFSWASTDVRYRKLDVPQLKKQTLWQAKA